MPRCECSTSKHIKTAGEFKGLLCFMRHRFVGLVGLTRADWAQQVLTISERGRKSRKPQRTVEALDRSSCNVLAVRRDLRYEEDWGRSQMGCWRGSVGRMITQLLQPQTFCRSKSFASTSHSHFAGVKAVPICRQSWKVYLRRPQRRVSTVRLLAPLRRLPRQMVCYADA